LLLRPLPLAASPTSPASYDAPHTFTLSFFAVAAVTISRQSSRLSLHC
jgi:hypothetical protein